METFPFSTSTTTLPAPATVGDARESGLPLDRSVAVPLLVCADGSLLRSGGRALESAGLAVLQVVGWSEALDFLEAGRPQVVLLDEAFLAGNGHRLCEALRRAAGPALPILVACAGQPGMRRALEAGASDVVAKPLEWQVVTRRLTGLATAFRTVKELNRCQTLLEEANNIAADACVRLERHDTFDSLTGLPTRAHLDTLVGRALAGAWRLDGGVALLFIDLDRFTEINDSIGRPCGDQALKLVAERLTDCLRRSDLLGGHAPGFLRAAARLSGDEFALMLTGVADEGALASFAREVLEALSKAMPVGGTELFLSASIGIARSSGQGGASKLLQDAETALFAAKRRGGAGYSLYSESLSDAAQSKLGMNRRLRAAFYRHELLLHYQPVVESFSGRVVAVEALLRWHDPALASPVPASAFVEIAEETGLMRTIGAWVFQEACRQLRQWQDSGLPSMRMAVNVSPSQLRDSDLPAIVRAALESAAVDPGLLELEISERCALHDDPGILSQFRELKRIGVRLVVDDFGTGQSAIAYLRQFPLDGLKIDRSFVMQLGRDQDDMAITSAIIAMAQRLRLDVVAEGVEEEAQLTILREYGCADIQGHFYSTALPADEFVRRLGPAGEMR